MTAKRVMLSDGATIAFKAGSLITCAGTLVWLVWTASSQWSALQARIATLERTVEWQTSAIRSLKKSP